MSKLFLLEDDLSLINGLSFAFQKAGHDLDIARTLQEAENLWQEGKYDLLILDVSLPDGSGFSFCEAIRQASQVPIIFLTASDAETSIIMGLDMGGDDYITKPFRLGELLSRIRALLRRSGLAKPADGLQCGDLFLDFTKSQALLKERPLDLTAGEYRLLCLLVRNAGQVLPRNRILDELWDGSGSFVDDNTLSVYIRRLREKAEEDPSHPMHLITVRGFGYQWKP